MRFFDTIEEFGSQQLKLLLQKTTSKFEKDKRFYFMLRGEKELPKHKILYQCLLLCALKWRISRGPKKGKLYQPQTFEQYLKQLFIVFKKKGIYYYCHQKDFNGPGEFHAVLVRIWNEEREKDTMFATGVQAFDFDADKKIREAYQGKNKFNPFSTEETKKAFEDRLRYLVFVFGRYFMLRGRKEIAF